MTKSLLILVVDDEPQIQRFLRHSLEASGYAVLLADRGSEAIRLATIRSPALIILDLGLPDLDGKAVIGAIRQTLPTPIIVLSAHDQETERIAALDLGADDFVAKPFGIGELLARVRVCLRASKASASDDGRIAVADLVIDRSTHSLSVRGQPVKLTPKEFELLALLASHPGKVLTHRMILGKVWGPAHVEDVPYLRVFIGQLRQKIEAVPAEPKLLLTEPGVGYRFADR